MHRWEITSPFSAPRPGPIDSPTVVHAVSDADTRHTEDFQVSPDGEFAAFPSVQKLLP